MGTGGMRTVAETSVLAVAGRAVRTRPSGGAKARRSLGASPAEGPSPAEVS